MKNFSFLGKLIVHPSHDLEVLLLDNKSDIKTKVHKMTCKGTLIQIIYKISILDITNIYTKYILKYILKGKWMSKLP